MGPTPTAQHVAVLSYTRDDDKPVADIRALRDALETEIGLRLGVQGRIFQDIFDIPPGADWRNQLRDASRSASVFLVILTPRFFESPECLEELQIFLEEEQRRNRSDLILPVTYLPIRVLEDRTELESAPPGVRTAVEALLRHQIFNAQIVREVSPERLLYEARSRSLVQQLAFQIVMRLQEGRPTRQSPVLTVGPSGQMYICIKHAIRKAPPGARIDVYPGVYNESLVIDQPLEIIGVSPRGSDAAQTRLADSNTQIRILGSGPAIMFNAAYGRIANIVVQPHPESPFPSHAVVVMGGRLQIADCDVSRSQFACILVQRDAHLEIARSRISRSAQGGLLFSDESTGDVNNCLVYANAHCGIHVMGHSRPTITENVIRGNDTFGVFVYQGARPVIRHNMIARNRKGGLLVSDEAQPIVVRNRIKCNDLQGVLVSGRYAGPPRGTYMLNTIANNHGLGVLVEYNADPSFRHNVIAANGSSGVHFQYGAGGLFVGNDIAHNRGYGVNSRDGRPTFARNHISGNREGDFEGYRVSAQG